MRSGSILTTFKEIWIRRSITTGDQEYFLNQSEIQQIREESNDPNAQWLKKGNIV